MAYEQSLKNIEILKNLVWPWDVDYIFFDFKTETEFEIIFFDKENSSKIEDYLVAKHHAELPVAHIHENKQGQEELYYEDKAFRFRANLVSQEIYEHNIIGYFKSCPLQMKLEIAALVRKLENM